MDRRIFIFKQLPVGPTRDGEWVHTGATGFEARARTFSFQEVSESRLFTTPTEQHYELIETKASLLVRLLLRLVGG